MAWTTDDFLTQLKVRCQLPDDNQAISDAELFQLADMAMQTDIASLVMSLKSEYWVKSQDVTLVSGTASYRMPYRAVGGKLRDLLLVDSNGNEVPTSEISPEDVWRYQSAGSVTWRSGIAYYVQGEHVVVIPTPRMTGYSLRFKYYVRRPRLVSLSANVNGAALTAVNANLSTATFTATPSGITTSTLVDTIRHYPYFDYIDLGSTVSAVGATTITTTYSSDVVVGDYVFVEDTTGVIPLPVEMHPVLMTATAVRVLTSLGDPKADVELTMLDREKHMVMQLLEPRNDGKAKRIINRSSPLRGGSWRRT